jgi:hypothetical protein
MAKNKLLRKNYFIVGSLEMTKNGNSSHNCVMFMHQFT